MSSRKSVNKQLRTNRAIMGLLRKSHFQSGGDLASWRGRHDVRTDRKKHLSKHACRGKVRWD